MTDSLTAQLPAIGDLKKLGELKNELRLAQRQRDTLGVGESCYLLGKFYQGLNEFKRAKFWFLQSLRIREPRAPSEDLVKVYIQLSGNSGSLLNKNQATEYNFKAFHTARKVKGPDSVLSLSRAYRQMAGMHASACRSDSLLFQLHSYEPYPTTHYTLSCDSAFFYYRLAMQKIINRPIEIASIKADIAGLYFIKGKHKEAISLFRQAIKGMEAHHKINPAITIESYLGHVFLSIGKTTAAEFHLLRAMKKYRHNKLQDPALLERLHENLSELYKQKGEFRQALFYQKTAFDAKLSHLVADRKGAIEQMETEYQTEKKEATIRNQAKLLAITKAGMEAETRLRTGLSGGLIATVFLLSVVLWLFTKNQKVSRQNAALVKEQNHRVKNNLQAISNLLELQASRLTDQAAIKAVTDSRLRIQSIELLHKRLYDYADFKIGVNLTDYVPEVTGRILTTFGYQHLQPVYDIAGIWLSPDQTMPLGLILTECITNACKYAFPTQAQPYLKIMISQRKDKLVVEIEDHGPGFSYVAGKRQSYGLRLIELQASQLDGTFAFSTHKGTLFRLTFPLAYENA